MSFLDLAQNRFSVRKFTNEHLSDETIEKILIYGNVAPTGCNYQPQRILVMNTDESLEKLKNCTKCHFNAPCAMLVCFDKKACWQRKYDGALSGPVDASIVATHLMLGAWEEGIGSCWVMHFDPFKMREAFSIPENIEPVALLVMGKPDSDAEPLNLHSEYKPLNDTVSYEKF